MPLHWVGGLIIITTIIIPPIVMGMVDIMAGRMDTLMEAIVDIMDTVILHIMMHGPITCRHILPLTILVIIIAGMVVAIRKL